MLDSQETIFWARKQIREIKRTLTRGSKLSCPNRHSCRTGKVRKFSEAEILKENLKRLGNFKLTTQ